ncbi:MAG: amidase [Micrococcales bacterium]|nr:amidase [Micrococcales bacterium]
MSDLLFQSVRDLAAGLRGREVSAREVLQAHLEQIEQTNPAVNAIVTLDVERARAEAAAADERLAHGEAVGPLHGLPAAFKDTHETEGMRTTFGSPLLRHNVPVRDELVIERLRAAGVVGLGKTNVPEFAAGSHTFNPVFGATRNPWDLSRSAGGSSGGAAAALASGMVTVAEGSDMGGSLRNPASFCGVVGLRPTPGRVPSHPVRLGWDQMAVQGPMGRSVDDVAIVLGALAGPDDRCPTSLCDPGAPFAEPLRGEVAGLRVAFSEDLGGLLPVEAEVRAAVRAAAAAYASAGAHVEEACLDFAGAEQVFTTLRAWQFHLAFGPLVPRARGRVREAIVWNAALGADLTGEDLARAETAHLALYHRAREFFGEWDVLVLPTSQVLPFDVGIEHPTQIEGQAQETYIDWMRSCFWVTATGCPALAVPATVTDAGLPVGVQLVGWHRQERRLLEAGRGLELALGMPQRRPQSSHSVEGPGLP